MTAGDTRMMHGVGQMRAGAAMLVVARANNLAGNLKTLTLEAMMINGKAPKVVWEATIVAGKVKSDDNGWINQKGADADWVTCRKSWSACNDGWKQAHGLRFQSRSSY